MDTIVIAATPSEPTPIMTPEPTLSPSTESTTATIASLAESVGRMSAQIETLSSRVETLTTTSTEATRTAEAALSIAALPVEPTPIETESTVTEVIPDPPDTALLSQAPGAGTNGASVPAKSVPFGERVRALIFG